MDGDNDPFSCAEGVSLVAGGFPDTKEVEVYGPEGEAAGSQDGFVAGHKPVLPLAKKRLENPSALEFSFPKTFLNLLLKQSKEPAPKCLKNQTEMSEEISSLVVTWLDLTCSLTKARNRSPKTS